MENTEINEISEGDTILLRVPDAEASKKSMDVLIKSLFDGFPKNNIIVLTESTKLEIFKIKPIK